MIDLTNEQRKKIFENWIQQWVQPEIERRFGKDIPSDFVIHEVLVKLPLNQPPIIEFNDEIQWKLDFKVDSHVNVNIGQPVYLHEVKTIERAFPPEVNGTRVSFMYLYRESSEYVIFVDFLPNQPDYDPTSERFEFDGSIIVNRIQRSFNERVVQWASQYKLQMREIGLWIATPLIPYPLSKIVQRINEEKPEEARKILIEYCDHEFISAKLVQTWWSIKVFQDRQKVFEEALLTHKNGLYHASICILINHIEGVITDWLHNILSPSKVKWTTKSRITQMSEELQLIPQFEYTYKEALEATIEFLGEGENAAMPFQSFKNWLDKTDPNFPSRHAVSHGKYVPEIYTEENSIKLFLLLDTICQFMMFYEERVLKQVS